MAEALHPSSEHHLDHVNKVAGNLYHDFSHADMQFNIGRLEGFPPRGLDILTRDGRLYLCEGSDIQSESLVRKELGASAVLRLVKLNDDVSVYKVPEGSQMIAKLFRQSPYEGEYMNRQAFRTGQFINRLRKLDSGLFGLAVQDIALTIGIPERANQDDINFTAVPPLKKPGIAQPVTDEMLAGQTVWFLKEKYQEHFFNGLKGD